MITTCTECQARYQLDAEKIPPRVIKVRCPSCGGVFSLDGTKAKEEAGPPQEETPIVQGGYGDFAAPPAPEVPDAADQASEQPEAPAEEPVAETPPVESPESPAVDSPAVEAPTAPVAEAPSPTAEPQVSESSTGVAVMDSPAASPSPSRRRRRCKEEMLARALVSDIMVYNRELYDKAKAEGNLLEALGAEIKKSWELYKEKVTPEVANSTNHFRDALNEILADGENIF